MIKSISNVGNACMNNVGAFWRMMSWVHAGQVLSLQSSQTSLLVLHVVQTQTDRQTDKHASMHAHTQTYRLIPTCMHKHTSARTHTHTHMHTHTLTCTADLIAGLDLPVEGLLHRLHLAQLFFQCLDLMPAARLLFLCSSSQWYRVMGNQKICMIQMWGQPTFLQLGNFYHIGKLYKFSLVEV